MGVIPPPPIAGFYNAIFNVGSMLVSALILIYLAKRVKGREYRFLFLLLVVFTLSHAAFHVVAGTGSETGNIGLVAIGFGYVWPLSNWLLVAFGVFLLRRELKVSGR